MPRRVARPATDASPPSPAAAQSPAAIAPATIADDALLAAMFAASPDGLIAVDETGRILRANAAAAALLPGSDGGARLADRIAPQSRLALEAAIAQGLAGRGASCDCLPHDPDGAPLAVAVVPLSGLPVPGALLVLRAGEPGGSDPEAAIETEKLEAIGRLTGGVAHDFNNILTVVIGNSELLAERLAADEEGRKLALISLAAAQAGADLTRMLLAYSRRQALQPTEFCPADLLREMRGLLERSLPATIALDVLCCADPWGVRADRAQLASVVLNLALNARDAMPQGGRLRIELSNATLDAATADVAADVAAGDYVLIAVQDTGTGIPAAVLHRVFEPFFTTKQVGKGSGLGLAMVQGFARQSGGHVAIDSRSGVGTTIRLYLPRAQVQLRLPEVTALGGDLRARAGETVLVAEDNPAVQALMSAQLEALGYEVVTAGDGQEALAILHTSQRIDLLLTDIVMPEIDGLTLAQRARRLRPALRILLTTGHADHAVERGSRLTLPGALLPKPFTHEELARRVRAAIDGKLA